MFKTKVYQRGLGAGGSQTKEASGGGTLGNNPAP